jgi:hypothetical protein
MRVTISADRQSDLRCGTLRQIRPRVLSFVTKDLFHDRIFLKEYFSESLVCEDQNQKVEHRGEVSEQDL